MNHLEQAYPISMINHKIQPQNKSNTFQSYQTTLKSQQNSTVYAYTHKYWDFQDPVPKMNILKDAALQPLTFFKDVIPRR